MARVHPTSWPRIASILALAIALLSLGVRPAAAKPKVAVLGVEVTGSITIDQVSTGVAHDVTEGLRSKAKQGNGPYQLAPNADRELIDEKVLKNCDSEGPLCMSDIGRDMGTDLLIYGQISKAGDGYAAKLHLLDVKKKTHEKEISVRIPGGAGSDAVRELAKKAYADLVGMGGSKPGGQTGTLVVSANVSEGTVFVDDEQKDTLSSGKATLTLPEGRYRVAIESPGHRRKEKSLKVDANDTSSETFELSLLGEGGAPGNPWKPVFGVTLGAAALLGGVSLYTFVSWRSKVGDLTASGTQYNDGRTGPVGDGDCNGSGIGPGVDDPQGALADLCSTRRINIATGIAAGAVGVVAVVAAYMAFFRQPKEPTTMTSSRSSAVRPGFSIAPVVTEHTRGAMLQLDW